MKIPLMYVDPEGLVTLTFRWKVVTLPEGMTVNPSGGVGLQAYSEPQVGLKTGKKGHYPSASRIGKVEVQTPLLPNTHFRLPWMLPRRSVVGKVSLHAPKRL